MVILSRIEEFLNKGKLKKMTISSDMVIKELRIGERDIELSKQSYEIKNYKWVTIQAYYGIYPLSHNHQEYGKK